MALDDEVCEMDVSRCHGLTTVACHCCWMECVATGTDMGFALSQLPCRASLRAFTLDAEIERGRRKRG